MLLWKSLRWLFLFGGEQKELFRVCFSEAKGEAMHLPVSQRARGLTSLLGSMVLLATFFLPYFGGQSWQLFFSGWQFLLDGLRGLAAGEDVALIFVVMAGVVFCLLLILVALALRAVLGVPRRDALRAHQMVVLVYLMLYVFSTVFLLWAGGLRLGFRTDYPGETVFALFGVGFWLVPVGLVLAFIGDRRLNGGTDGEREPFPAEL